MLNLDLGNGTGRNCASTFEVIMIRSWKLLGSFVVVAAACVSLWIPGCGGGGSSTPITVGAFCQQKADKECQVTTRCGNATPSACSLQRVAVCMAFANAATVAPRVFHPENVNACVNKTNSVYTKATAILPSDLADLDDVCNYVFQGNSTTTCAVKYDCATASKICDKGRCADKVTKNKDQLCGNPGEVCATGSYCKLDTASTTYTCVAKGAQGAACDAATPCVEALRCDSTATCQPRANPTETCATNDDCATTAPYCDPYIGHKCDSGLSFGGGAAACVDYGAGASTGTGGSTGTTDAATGG
jgi:hypothetical protein